MSAFCVGTKPAMVKLANQVGQGYHQFGEDDTVWEDEEGRYWIGTADDIAEEDAGDFVEMGTVADFQEAV